MFLCIDPGSKYVGYTLISNSNIIHHKVINIFKEDLLLDLKNLLKKYPQIHTVLIEKGEKNLRPYESIFIKCFKQNNLNILIFNAKEIRKKLRLERHPKDLSIKAKENLFVKNFPSLSIKNFTIHEIDSALLYLYFKKYNNHTPTQVPHVNV